MTGDVPERLDEWGFETVVALLQRHEYEPGRFDYKEVLNATGPGRDDALASLWRTVCSMANADGGYILFGIRDRHQYQIRGRARMFWRGMHRATERLPPKAGSTHQGALSRVALKDPAAAASRA